MLAWIILRDIPKDRVQLDFSIFDVQGGFRGFNDVFPGLHYISLRYGDNVYGGSWLFLDPGEVVVRVFDSGMENFTDDDLENEENYRMLAKSGAMNRALIPVLQCDYDAANLWQRLVSHVNGDMLPVKFNHETPMMPPIASSPADLEEFYTQTFKSRIEQAFLDTHEGKEDAFLAEFEFSFVKALLQDDEDAWARWTGLTLAFFNCGENFILENQNLVASLVEVLSLQLSLLPEEWTRDDAPFFKSAAHLIEDLEDSAIPDLQEKGNDLSNVLVRLGVAR